ncbi:PAS domain S-box protein [Aetokthonos hydrillicola Thurmond2011]|jgi:PAS domain S-box-containing protein|uniref:PAS domain S-box protein n=1 Tax=Aetokthonos hydrillicola Thurmond2011 TaxID=2712845 RepID=A0AAP5M795_9CYAN|nr:PAS domain S-box protein [Aetokthonos hydrillicola]MBO3463602.1 PAS domain S-box protein [Aetokthonos hydrillicola CCALA 1050]MBW4587713.1 PAS domain S-box protein [Aetokthonos hydrillicola CCALA 1050]MDR9897906.1 PAS domain S-box protein [Aetokthonos hydrillicola Thurmond2011]
MTTIANLKRESQLPVIITDHEGIVNYINPIFETTFGWSCADIVGQPLTLILPSYFQDAHNLGFSRFSTTGVSTVLNHPLQLKVRTKDNSEIESEHIIIAEKQQGQWVFAATLRPLET